MTEAEISRRLALAIGWPRAVAHPDGIYVREFTDEMPKPFDYRDPAVIWPIAERFNKFPYALRDVAGNLNGKWNAWVNRGEDLQADTAAKAVALAVIKAHEAKK
jgi:hypothetical protein